MGKTREWRKSLEAPSSRSRAVSWMTQVLPFLIMTFFILVVPHDVLGQGKISAGLKVYISVDLEGIGGTIHGYQVDPEEGQYNEARTWMTSELLAAIEAAKEMGATEILVSDSHDGGMNLQLDRIPSGVRVVRGIYRPLLMMEGIDSSFDAAIFLGYHPSAGTPSGILAHSFTGDIYNVRINGIRTSEGIFNAALAGAFGVPVVLVAGDQAAVDEIKAAVGDIETAPVKKGIGLAGIMMPPSDAQQLIREKTKKALGRLKEFKPFDPGSPYTLEIDFAQEDWADWAQYIPGAKRIGDRTIAYTHPDFVKIAQMLYVILLRAPYVRAGYWHAADSPD